MKKLLLGLVAAMCCLAMAAPVLADIKVGGMITSDLYYWERSKERFQALTPGATTLFEDLSLVRFAMPQAWNRLWVDYKSDDKKLAGYIQLRTGGAKAYAGTNTGNAATATGFNENNFTWEYAWIDWHFNPNFYLRVGRQTQTFAIYTPDQNMGHVDGHIIGSGFGNIHGGTSRDGIRAYIKFSDMVRMEVQLLDPNSEPGATDELTGFRANAVGALTALYATPAFGLTAAQAAARAAAEGAALQEENTIPRVDISLPIKIANFSIEPSVTWLRQEFNIPSTLVGLGGDDKVDIWAAALGAKAGFGPFTISGEVTYGQNLGWGNYVGAQGFAVPSINVDASNNIQIEDAKTLAAWIELEFNFGPFAIQGIVGRDRTKVDEIPGIADSATENTTWMYGLNFPIKVAKNFTVTPNIFLYDYDDGGDVTAVNLATGGIARTRDIDRGTELMVGVQFNLTF